MTDKKKGKLPSDNFSLGDTKVEYPWFSGQTDIIGNSELKHINPNKTNESFEISVNSRGSTTISEYNKENKEVKTDLSVGQLKNYVSEGQSSHADGHIDRSSKSTIRENSDGDRGVAGKTFYETATQGKVSAIKEFNTQIVTSASESKSKKASYGDQIEEHSGHWHEAFEKDHVGAVSGNKITMVEKGDYAVHVQKGNFDMQVTEGKLHLMSKQNDLIANSNVKVLLQVGSDAKVTVEPSKIKFQVGDGSYIEITAGGIKMISPRIDLN